MKTTLFVLSVFLTTSLFGQNVFEDYLNDCKEHIKNGEYQEALDDINIAVNMNPDSEIAYNNRGNNYFNLEKYQEAIIDYNTAIKIKSDFAPAYCNRASSKAYLGIDYCDDYKKACELGNERGCNFLKIAECNWSDIKDDFSVDAGSYAAAPPCSENTTMTENKYLVTLNSDNNYSFQSNIDPDDTFVLNLDGDYLRSIPVDNDDFIVTYKRQ